MDATGGAVQGAAADGTLYELAEDDCWALLERETLGRLAIDAAGIVDLFPINYVVDGRRVFFKTTEGTKLAGLAVHDQVAFEIDGTDELTAWSVVVKGRARVLDDWSGLGEVERHRIVSWLPTVKSRVVVLEPESVTGRSFVRGQDPDSDWY
ncbi:MAG: pyridoxamine 5'-phosphate oxidase family protein [Amnibacterium sp.]